MKFVGFSKLIRFLRKMATAGHRNRIIFASLTLLTIMTLFRIIVDSRQKLFKRKDRSYLQYQASTLDVNSVTKSPRIMCIILTTWDRQKRFHAVNNTWVKRCDNHLFVMAYEWNAESGNKDVLRNTSDILVLNKPDGREHLTFKVRMALKYVHDFYLGAFDWVLKADDDTYVIIENLHNLLSHYDPEKPGYIGHLFKVIVHNGYMSGGAGYAISNCGLRQLITRGFRDNACRSDGGDEDVEIGKCLLASGVDRLSSVDDKGRQSFLPEDIGDYYPWDVPYWPPDYSWSYPQKGLNCCSQHIVSFHHVTARDVYLLEHVLYNTQVFGRPERNDPKWQIGIVTQNTMDIFARLFGKI